MADPMQRTPPEDISPAHIRGGNEGTVEQDPPERENHRCTNSSEGVHGVVRKSVCVVLYFHVLMHFYDQISQSLFRGHMRWLLNGNNKQCSIATKYLIFSNLGLGQPWSILTT
jgi:hypothetical protein